MEYWNQLPICKTNWFRKKNHNPPCTPVDLKRLRKSRRGSGRTNWTPKDPQETPQTPADKIRPKQTKADQSGRQSGTVGDGREWSGMVGDSQDGQGMSVMVGDCWRWSAPVSGIISINYRKYHQYYHYKAILNRLTKKKALLYSTSITAT